MSTVFEKMYDEIRYSDPVSSPRLGECEEELYACFREIRGAAAAGDSEAAGIACKAFSQKLKARNAMCKSLKN